MLITGITMKPIRWSSKFFEFNNNHIFRLKVSLDGFGRTTEKHDDTILVGKSVSNCVEGKVTTYIFFIFAFQLGVNEQ